jgi:predicted PurR-regulated permease PerM
VVITAVAQALLGGLGVAVAGVPGAMVLTTVMFLLTIAQIGPLPVLLSCCGWLLWSGQTGAAIGLLLWSGVVGTIDNLLRPG